MMKFSKTVEHVYAHEGWADGSRPELVEANKTQITAFINRYHLNDKTPEQITVEYARYLSADPDC
jgi:hypothetical protein